MLFMPLSVHLRSVCTYVHGSHALVDLHSNCVYVHGLNAQLTYNQSVCFIDWHHPLTCSLSVCVCVCVCVPGFLYLARHEHLTASS